MIPESRRAAPRILLTFAAVFAILLLVSVAGRLLPPRFHDISLDVALERLSREASSPLLLKPVEGLASELSVDHTQITLLRMRISRAEVSALINAFAMEESEGSGFSGEITYRFQEYPRWGPEWFKEWEKSTPAAFATVEGRGDELYAIFVKDSDASMTAFIDLMTSPVRDNADSTGYARVCFVDEEIEQGTGPVPPQP